MKRNIGIFCIVLGTILILGAVSLFAFNENESRSAEKFATDMLPEIQNEIAKNRSEEYDPNNGGNNQMTPEGMLAAENIPEEYQDLENYIMPEVIINGQAYVGYLEIPQLNLNLPVMSSWDMKKLKTAPCRYSGATGSGDLVIMAHNYRSHFGGLSKLSEGSEVYFTDADGTVWKYRVEVIDILPAAAVEEMIAGEYDLTLFTCAPNRITRVTVRCNRV